MITFVGWCRFYWGQLPNIGHPLILWGRCLQGGKLLPIFAIVPSFDGHKWWGWGWGWGWWELMWGWVVGDLMVAMRKERLIFYSQREIKHISDTNGGVSFLIKLREDERGKGVCLPLIVTWRQGEERDWVWWGPRVSFCPEHKSWSYSFTHKKNIPYDVESELFEMMGEVSVVLAGFACKTCLSLRLSFLLLVLIFEVLWRPDLILLYPFWLVAVRAVPGVETMLVSSNIRVGQKRIEGLCGSKTLQNFPSAIICLLPFSFRYNR